MKNEDATMKNDRIQFSRYNYTILESIILMKEIKDRSEELNTINSLNDYLKFLNDFFSFHAHIGRIRDMIKYIDHILGCEQHKCLEDFWQARINVIHSPKLPFAKIDSKILTVVPSVNVSDEGWRLSDLWNNADNKDVDEVINCLCSTFYSLCTRTNSILYTYKSKISEYMISNSLQLKTQSYSTNTQAISGEFPTDSSGEIDINRDDF